jgi:uncharacterized protein YfaQ (DUF2300 family)
MRRLGWLAVLVMGAWVLLSSFVARAKVVTFKVGTVAVTLAHVGAHALTHPVAHARQMSLPFGRKAVR